MSDNSIPQTGQQRERENNKETQQDKTPRGPLQTSHGVTTIEENVVAKNRWHGNPRSSRCVRYGQCRTPRLQRRDRPHPPTPRPMLLAVLASRRARPRQP